MDENPYNVIRDLHIEHLQREIHFIEQCQALTKELIGYQAKEAIAELLENNRKFRATFLGPM